MKSKKIIMSFLLILLITISISAISAAEDSINDQDIISSDTGISDKISSDIVSADEITKEEINKGAGEKSLKDGIITGNNYVPARHNNQTNDTEIQKTINSYGPGNTVQLQVGDKDLNATFNNPVVINKNFNVKGGTIYNTNLDYLFYITPISEGGPTSVTISDATFYVNGNESIVYTQGNIVGNNKLIQIANITIKNCKIIPINEDISSNISNTSLLKINAALTKDDTTGTISLLDNSYNGASSLNINDERKYDKNIVINGQKANLNTTIEVNDKSITACDEKIDVPSYLTIRLFDEEGKPLANKPLEVIIYDIKYMTTDSNGTVKLPLTMTETSFVYVHFNGDENYKGSLAAATVYVTKKTSNVKVKTYTYSVNAKTKKLSATVLDKNNKPVIGRKVSFTVNGKTYNGKTNSKGVATVTITLNKKGTYTYTAKFAGDDVYSGKSAKGTLKINGLSTSLTVKKYTYNRYATKKIQVTLKSGKTVLKSKKISVKVNGKTYSAKTNSKGVATVTVKLSKKGTYTYTASFAGDNIYKATSKSQKLVIK